MSRPVGTRAPGLWLHSDKGLLLQVQWDDILDAVLTATSR
jgi:hypothetical protein